MPSSMQCDQKKIILCLIREQTWFCPLCGNFGDARCRIPWMTPARSRPRSGSFWALPQCSDWHIKCFMTNGRSWPGRRAAANFRLPTFSKIQERLNDEIQARVYLARRLYAGAEPARQNADQGIRLLSDIGTASAVGFRRLIDDAGRGPQLR